ncbi:MAG TPA: thiol reductase thioredoxin [Syntrophaceae bacterium]|jgi:thioredoxin 1|nr:thiol reductase thioredoxin [Syntrophaceae bacterium]
MSIKRITLIGTLIFTIFFFVNAACTSSSTEYKKVPVKGMVTMVDLGAASCIPCKMMAPILDRLEKRYQGKAAIVFIDLRYNREAIQQFQVRAIPTQIFFDKKGREISRHIGYMSEEAIVAQLKTMGVQ